MNGINPERAMLGAILNGWRGDLDELPLTAGDFYHPAHEQVWNALHADRDPYKVQASLHGTRVDPVIVAELMAEACLPGQVEHYAVVIAEAGGKRALTDVGRRTIQLGENTTSTLEELVEEAKTALDKIGVHNQSNLVDMAQAVADATETLDHPERGFAWPWDINDRMMPILPGRVYVIAARPGQGKSIAGQNLAVDAARRGLPVAYASMEMTRDEITHRMIAQVGSIELSRIERGTMTDNDWNLYATAAAHISQLPIHIDDESSQTVAHIRAHARQVHRRHGTLGLVVVDYLQLADSTVKGDRHLQVGEISRSLHKMAKDLKVPVIALAQLNRDSVNTGKPPTMANLRESGSIEQDADAVILLHADEDLPGQLEWHVPKQRNGIKGWRAELAIAGHHARIEDLT